MKKNFFLAALFCLLVNITTPMVSNQSIWNIKS